MDSNACDSFFGDYGTDPHEMNRRRAHWALTALEAFGNQTGQRYGFRSFDLGEDVLGEVGGDLLADLFHLARFNDVTPEELYERGRGHFDAEVDEEEAADRDAEESERAPQDIAKRTRDQDSAD